ncbi:hypothetical protein EV182_008038, partial [Spiromyces aspiralis]
MMMPMTAPVANVDPASLQARRLNPPHMLFNLPTIDPVEPWQLTMMDNYQMVKDLITGKSDMEIHDNMHQKASQSMELHHKLAEGLLLGILVNAPHAKN